MSRIMYRPIVDRHEIQTGVVEWAGLHKATNRVQEWVIGKVFNYLVRKGFLQNQSNFSSEVGMVAHEIDLDKLDEQIAMNQEAIRAVYNQKVDVMICGHDIMSNIMKGDPYRAGQVSISMTQESRYASFAGRDFYMAPQYERVQYRGLTVILVPWFKGILLLEGNNNASKRNYTTY